MQVRFGVHFYSKNARGIILEKSNNILTLGSLFDGSGGFPLAAELSGIRPIWASEIEPFPIMVTKKRFPYMEHYGDINKLNGANLPPVDIITFGSPCQGLSICGKRNGLADERSNLFYQAIRIIKEMRCKTNGKYPKYAIWENVPGSTSSNNGLDFKTVLEEFCRIKEPEIIIPKPKKWENSGYILGDGYSVAYRIFDASLWGVPQRRKRIYLVADLDGERAGKILFESEGLSGYSAQGFRAWQETAEAVGNSIEAASRKSIIILNDQGGDKLSVSDKVVNTLRANGHIPVVFENHGAAVRYKETPDVSQTITATMGKGGNNQPLVVEKILCVDQGGGKSACNITENVSPTLTCTHGGEPVIAIQGTIIGRKSSNGPKGRGPSENICYTLDTVSQHAVAYKPETIYTSSGTSHFTSASKDIAATLTARDHKEAPLVRVNNGNEYIVRRLTPQECAKLQGFPTWWCSDIGISEPTDDDIAEWRERFIERNNALGKTAKPKTDNQIRKWLKDPYSESAEYTMWGNGVSLPCPYFVLSGIEYFNKCKE